MHKALLITLLAFIGFGYAYWDVTRTPSTLIQVERDNIISTKNKVPDFVFQTLGGESQNLYDFEGKIIILNFWATWCPPCVAEFPQLIELAKNNPNDVILLAISVDENKDNITRFFNRYQLDISSKNIIISHDAGKKISQDLFQTSVYPETFIISRDLTIEQKINGAIDWTTDTNIKNLIKTIR